MNRKKNDDSSSSPISAVVITTGSPLYVKIGLKWESDTGSTFTDYAACSVDPGNIAGSCEISIPEARLHYSSVRFTAGSQVPSDCAILSFQPYYYQRSSDSSYTPPNPDTSSTGSAVVDCSVNSPSKKCFGGAAPTLVAGFPKSTGLYFLPGFKPEATFDIQSENTLRWYGDGAYVNYLITNSLSPANQAIDNNSGGPKSRIANTWVDYKLVCQNLWAETTHILTFTIKDKNVDDNDPGGADDLPDWN